MKIFIDTNVLISAMLFPESKTAYVFDYILEMHQPVICSYSIDEAYKVFEKKFPHKLESLKNFFDKLDYEHFISPKSIDMKKYPEMREPNDVPILVSAVLSDSDILLTGDKDFDNLDLKRPLILSPSKYYDLIE